MPGRRPEVRREGEYRAAQRGAHRYIRDSAPEPHDPAHTILIGGPAEDPRHAPAAGPRHRRRHIVVERLQERIPRVVPGDVGVDSPPARVKLELRPTHGGDQRVRGRPLDDAAVVERARGRRAADAVVVGGPDHGDAGASRPDVGPAQAGDRASGEVLLGQAEALADHVSETVRDHIVLGGHHLREAAARHRLADRGLDEQDARPGSDGVRPLHVERRLARLDHLLGIAGIERWNLPHRLQDPERGRIGQPKGPIERLQVGSDRRRPERIDDHDRPPPAVEPIRVQRPQVIGAL